MVRVEWATTSQGRIQFIVHAESREEQMILKMFDRERQDGTFAIHGLTYSSGALGPDSFNFGTVNKPPAEEAANAA